MSVCLFVRMKAVISKTIKARIMGYGYLGYLEILVQRKSRLVLINIWGAQSQPSHPFFIFKVHSTTLRSKHIVS